MFSTNHCATFNCPVETAEARYGFNVLKKRFLLARFKMVNAQVVWVYAFHTFCEIQLYFR
jgi:hypothetical protein